MCFCRVIRRWKGCMKNIVYFPGTGKLELVSEWR